MYSKKLAGERKRKPRIRGERRLTVANLSLFKRAIVCQILHCIYDTSLYYVWHGIVVDQLIGGRKRKKKKGDSQCCWTRF